MIPDREAGARLDNRQTELLDAFIDSVDRGAAEIFVGRQKELKKISSRLSMLRRRCTDPVFREAPGADMTLVFQGAPGAGKSALLANIGNMWRLKRGDGPSTATLAADSLLFPFDRLLATIAAKLPDKNLADRLQGSPVMLLIDEIQSVADGEMTLERRQNFTINLRRLHDADHGLPIFPIFAGLANSADLLRDVGQLTRLSYDAETTLGRFVEETSTELFHRFAENHLSSAMPPPETLEAWKRAMLRDSQGWPMHCRNFLLALADAIKEQDWRPAAADLDEVRMRAARLRCDYYGDRMREPLKEREELLSTILEEMECWEPMGREAIIREIREANRKARSDSQIEEDWRWTLPDGVTAEHAFDAMLRSGIVQKFDKYTFACPIPSLAGHVSAMAACPSATLHYAVVRADPDGTAKALERRPNQEARAKLLHANDTRGRTPLILAAETGLFPLVELLAEFEADLPDNLRDASHADVREKTALDHAEDERARDVLRDLVTRPRL